ncbi:MAG: hypothetical protein HZB55_05895 [Deltaproteobacteria bacterium]|nr:hypothetical protein [Deltaproteobacteria bacterium]
MRYFETDPRQVARLLANHWRKIAAATAAGALSAALAGLLAAPPASYEAVSTVRFQKSSTPVGVFLESVSYSGADEIRSQEAVITSFSVLQDAAQRLRLSVSTTGAALGDGVAGPSLRAVEDLQARVTATRRPETDLIDVRARHEDPSFAARLANTVAEAYREANAKEKNQRVRSARQFIEAQLRPTEERLREAEERLRGFQETKGVVNPEFQMDAALREEERLRLEIQGVEAALSGSYAGGGPSGQDSVELLADQSLRDLRARRLDLELRRQELLRHYTPEHSKVQSLDTELRTLDEARSRALGERRQGLQVRRAALLGQLARLRGGGAALPASALRLADLRREVKVEEDLFSLLKSKYQEALIKEAEPIEEVTVVYPAFPPHGAVNPRSSLLGLVAGAVAGFLIGLLWAVGGEAFGLGIEHAEDLESRLGLHPLALFPWTAPDRAWADVLDEAADAASPVALACRKLRSTLGFDGPPTQPRAVGLAAAGPMETPYPAALELALALAQGGRRTVLLEGRLDRPRIAERLGLPERPGLTELLMGTAAQDEVERGVPDFLVGGLDPSALLSLPALERLTVVPAGKCPSVPSDFLAAAELTTLLKIFKARADVVVVELPPLLSRNGAQAFAAQLDGVVLACGGPQTRAPAVRESRALWEKAGGTFLGAFWVEPPSAPVSVPQRPPKAPRVPMTGRAAAWAAAVALTAAAVGFSLWVQGRLGGAGRRP